jgi:hypothetical protein
MLTSALSCKLPPDKSSPLSYVVTAVTEELESGGRFGSGEVFNSDGAEGNIL